MNTAPDEMDQLRRLRRLRDDLEYFGTECLKIRNKAGEITPLNLNKVQKVCHAKLERQREEKGWVRALILKGRQPGISTYVAARYYQRASLRRGQNVYILAHERAASETLFGIVDRYQRGNPIAPHVGTSNIKELEFDKLDSSYAVATAGTKAGGRSKAISLFHGSEVAFWENAPDHFAASVQGVPLMPDTEVILESTSAGATGEFYERCMDAEAYRGDYQLIFLPWFLSDGVEYQREPEPGFVLNNEAEEGEISEEKYADIYKVSLPQMCWRRNKIIEMRSSLLFRREYPADSADAWTPPPGHEPFIAPMLVQAARQHVRQGVGPLILGVDPASLGGDRFSITARRGLCAMWTRYREKIDHNEGTAWVKSLIDELHPARVNIDAGNIGVTIVTNLRNAGPQYVDVVRAVNFGSTSEAKMARPKVPGPANRRAEMWSRLRDWLMLEEGVQIPDEPALQTDLTAPKIKPRLNGDYLLESKQDMKARKVRSPDMADSLALTFASTEWITDYEKESPVQTFGNVDAPQPTPLVDSAFQTVSTGWMA